MGENRDEAMGELRRGMRQGWDEAMGETRDETRVRLLVHPLNSDWLLVLMARGQALHYDWLPVFVPRDLSVHCDWLNVICDVIFRYTVIG